MRPITKAEFEQNRSGAWCLKDYLSGQWYCPIHPDEDCITCDCEEHEMYNAAPETYTRFGQEQAARAADWFARYLACDKQARKEAPIARGLHGYFPNACINVAHVSYVANEQHNPGLPMQWAFDKSTDEADCQVRHALDAAASPFDDDGLLHLAKKAWRANAELERYLLEHYPEAKPGASVTGLVRK